MSKVVAVFNNDSVRFCSRGLVRGRRRLWFVAEGRVSQRVEEAAVLRERYVARRRRGASNIEATKDAEARGRRRPLSRRRRRWRLRRSYCLWSFHGESHKRGRQRRLEHGRRGSRRVKPANHDVGVERAGDTLACDERRRPQRPEALPQFLLLLRRTPLLLLRPGLGLQDADDEFLLRSQRRVNVGRLLR